MTQPLDAPTVKCEPYWWEAAPLVALPEEPLPKAVDVAIVGAGYTGLSAAITLARRGRSVAVLEAERPGEGASSRNGGIASGNLKYGVGAMIERFGRDGALALYNEGKQARESLKAFIETEGIQCHFAMHGRFTGANTPAHYEGLARDAELLRKHLGVEAEVVARAEQHREIGSDFYHGGQVRPDIGGLHPGLFFRGLLDVARKAGATVFGGTRVAGLKRKSQGFTVATARGRIAARDVIVATNGYTGAATPWFRRRVIPIRSQIIATEPLGANMMARLMPKGRMLGDTSRLYNYYRPAPDGGRIIFGGRAGALAADPRESGRHLYRNLTAIFPDLQGIGVTHTWSGNTGYTFDLLPHIGVKDGVHYAMGFCGSGVVWAPWFGRKIAEKLLGEPAGAIPFEQHRFQTRPLYWGQPWFLPFVMTWYGARDWIDRKRA
ncbi:MAG: FAD-binding oxidoreductase [Rhodospirillales bacterium]|nr:FAD-binding oxidoreductase [Rhodospirillales bacterium]